MRIILMGLFALFLTTGLAHAGWNIQQQDDGSTVWVDDNSEQVAVGNDGITVTVTDLATAATYFVISNRDGKIKKVYALNSGTFDPNSNSPDLSVGTGPGNSVGTFTPVSLGAAADSAVHLTLVTSVLGTLQTFTPADVAVDVSQGGVISINTDGDATCSATCSGSIVIIIE